MNIEEYRLTLDSLDGSGCHELNRSLILCYRGNENITIECKSGIESNFIQVPRDILTKFLEMIR
jgi:hypothetical protein